MVRTQPLRRPAALGIQTLAVAACYFAAGRLGLLRRLVVEGAVVTPVWPPTGIALACLLLYGKRSWPGIALGALLVVMSIAPLGPGVIATLAGNTAAPVCSWLMLRKAGFRTDLGRLRDGLALVFLGALTGMLISATAGAGVLWYTGRLDAHSFWPVWSAWWVGDAMGVLLVTPVLLLLRRAHWPPPTARWKEALGLTLVACVLIAVATRSALSVLFLVYPLLIWTALRFELAGSALCALACSVLATVAATDGAAGPFAGLSRVEVMIKLQAFNMTMALTALLLSALITEQRNTRRSIERACLELAEVLEHLAPGETPPARPPAQDSPRERHSSNPK
ncbi:MASE1 domain-containing protein [Streptomyces sp. NPDC059785]|uniref:MASE1 domain-containing protein n=1 Tax=unclassified Streptomyces TaxID=2593676 RepID=UPI003647B954